MAGNHCAEIRMNEQAMAQTRKADSPKPDRKNPVELGRQCSCGQHTSVGSQCAECQKRRLAPPRWGLAPAAPASLLWGGGPDRAPIGPADAAHGHDFSRVAARASEGPPTPETAAPAAEAVATPRETAAASSEAASSGLHTATSVPSASGDSVSTAPQSEASVQSSTSLIVEDGDLSATPRQMTKSEFLAEVRSSVSAAMEPILAGAGRTTDGCPYLEFVFRFFGSQDLRYLERTVQRFAPEAVKVESARDYIPFIVDRARRSAQTWAETGRIEGLPQGVPSALLNLRSAAAGARASAEPLSPVLAKSKGGGLRNEGAPETMLARLGRGKPLDGGVRGRMESAFGRSFASVRTHTDNQAAGLSDELNARAFTVGRHVAFGAGQYRPGTMIGDALIAHELAHVVQQDGAGNSMAFKGLEAARGSALEADADRSAAGVVAALWGGAKESGQSLFANSMPRLKSGLSLQRCRDSGPSQQQTQQQPQQQPQGEAAQRPTPALSRRVTTPPTDHGCGGFEMGGIFSVDNADENTNGFVVQKLTFDLQREGCEAGNRNYSTTYYEAWQVRRGVVYIGTLQDRHDSDGVGDRFYVPPTPDHRGVNFEEGRAKYMDGYTAPLRWGNIREAGALPATYDEPPEWSDSGTIHRWLRSEFNCCDGATDTNFTHQS
ncbi:MAG TPA: DUF4157 domain-containing protein [Acidobacteriota bacterium]|nr:DUF4157 domain-containing protein [Acidobacteriota bacterium]